jgi:dTDP-4-dehydrorhamnose reductase
MLRLAADRPALRVVDDQHGCPTSATDIAAALITITRRLIEDTQTHTGTYHFVNDGEASWCDFARAIFSMAAVRGRSVPTVEAICSANYPTPAKRPANSRLSTAKLRRDFDIVPRPWQPAIEEIVDVLLTRSKGMDS